MKAFLRSESLVKLVGQGDRIVVGRQTRRVCDQPALRPCTVMTGPEGCVLLYETG